LFEGRLTLKGKGEGGKGPEQYFLKLPWKGGEGRGFPELKGGRVRGEEGKETLRGEPEGARGEDQVEETKERRGRLLGRGELDQVRIFGWICFRGFSDSVVKESVEIKSLERRGVDVERIKKSFDVPNQGK